MSGIYIPGMEMPQNCCECFAFKSNASGNLFCKAKRLAFGKEDAEWLPKTTPNWCPLIPVPDHGRLIDADALRQAMYHQAFETDSPMQKWDSGCWIRYKMFERMEEAAPTIIPADEEGGGE